MQSNSPSRKRRRMVSEVSDIPSHMAKYDSIDDGTPHITRCPPSLAMHWANMSSETSARNRRGSVIRRCVMSLIRVCTEYGDCIVLGSCCGIVAPSCLIDSMSALMIVCFYFCVYLFILHMCCIIVTRWGGSGGIEA